MIRIFARRPLIFWALSLCLGVFVMVKGLEKDSLLAFCILLLIITLFTIFSILIYPISFKTKIYSKFLNFISVNRLLILGCLIMYVIGGLFAFNKINYFTTNVENQSYKIVGIVNELDNYYSSNKVYLRDVVITYDNDNIKLKGIVCLTYYEDDTALTGISVGDKISFTGLIESNYAIKNESLDYYSIKDNVRYYAEYQEDFTIIDKGLISANDVIRFKVLDTLLQEMPSTIAYLSYSILFGDDSYLSDFTYESFKISGVAHIVAVSGMNVVIIVTLLLFVMRFLKSKKWLKFLIITLVLVAYCYLCDFTPSVVRATIMALVVLSAKFVGRQNDIMSSLGLSCILICCIWPLSIFDVGFLMSFASVLGIVLYFTPFNNFLNKKCKIPNFLSSSISVTVVAQIGIYPIMASYFNSFSLYSIPANVVIVPIFSLAYILLFATTIISLILPFLSFTLFLPSVVMSFVNWFPSVFVNLPFANLYVFELGVLSIFYYAFLLFSSSFIFLNDKIKIPINIVLTTAIITFFVLDILPKKFTKDEVKTFDTSASSVLVTTESNSKFMIGVGNSYDLNKVVESVQRNRIYNLDAIFLVNYKIDAYNQRTNIEVLQEVCKVKSVYVADNLLNAFETIKDTNVMKIPNNNLITINETNIYPLFVNNQMVALLFDLNEFDFAYVLDINESQSYFVKTMLNEEVNVYCIDKNDYEYFVGYPQIT